MFLRLLSIFLLNGLLMISSVADASGRSVECGKRAGNGYREAEFTLELDSANPRGSSNGSGWAFYSAGKLVRGARISVLQGPRHRRGIDGYQVKVAEAGSPLSPREVYEFTTFTCPEEASLQRMSGAGIGRDHPQGSELPCVCIGW